LEKEPERRYQHASEVKTDVQTIAGPAKVNTPQIADTRSRHTWKLVAVAFLAGFAACYLIILFRHARPSAPVPMAGMAAVPHRTEISETAAPTESNGASDRWASTQIATLDKGTGVLSAKMPDLGLIEFLAAGGLINNTNRNWRADGSLVTDTFREIKVKAEWIGEGTTGESLQYRNFFYRVSKNNVGEGDSAQFEFEPKQAADISSSVGGSDDLRLGFRILVFPSSVRAVTMRAGRSLGDFLPISTMDAHGKISNRPPRAGEPQFDPDWGLWPQGDGVPGVKLLLNVDHRYCDVQILAVDTNGVAHLSNGGVMPSQSGKTAVYRNHWNKDEIGYVREFVAEVRPIAWVEFPNIQLQPTTR
jgi:hypothetical protein